MTVGVRHVRLRAYRDFLEDLSKLLSAGVPVREALQSIAASPSRAAAAWARALEERIRAGAGLGEAMGAEKDLFPAAHAALIAAAERVGAAPRMLLRLRDEADRRLAWRQALVARAAYPCLVLVLSVLLPPLYLLFQGRFWTYLALEVGFFGGAAALVLLWTRFAARLRPALRRLPFLGTALRRAEAGEALCLLGLLLEAGLGPGEALRLAGEAARSEELARQLRAAGADLASGSNLTDSLGRLEDLPPSGAARLRTGETAGAADRALAQIGSELEDSARRSVQALLALLPVALILAVGAVVLVLAARAIDQYLGLGGEM